MWNGAFSPRFTKSVGRVKFVPLSRMTPRDWEWLDYDNIRTIARNRIATLIVRGQLVGFFQVMITEKAAKNEYFWPATPEEVRQLSEGGDPEFFRHEAEVETETDAVDAVERLRFGIGLIPLPIMMLILRQIVQYVADEDKSQQVKEVSEKLLESIEEDARAIILSSIMLWWMELEEAERLIDDMPESDEVDEIRDWIADQFAAIEVARRQIAAVRGLTSPN